MFVLKSLIKKINENYYKNYKNTVMYPVDENTSQKTIRINKIIAKKDEEMVDMLEDLFMLIHIDADYKCISKYGKELRKKELNQSKQNSIFKKYLTDIKFLMLKFTKQNKD